MSRTLVIPDVHLKPRIFDRAATILESGQAEFAVVLGDLVDDWGQYHNIDLYERTLNQAIDFAKEFPKTLWCYGNHDLSYIWRMQQSGYSYTAQFTCESGLKRLYATICRSSDHNPPMGVVQRVDNVWFSHAGVTEDYALKLVGTNKHKDGTPWANDDNFIFNLCNDANIHALWEEDSPVWARPQDVWGRQAEMYKAEKIMQVVGHTPMKKITFVDNLLSTDVFSTYQDGTPIGERKFAIVDTKKQSWEYADEDL